MSSIVLLPVGLFILKKAADESAVFDKEKYQKFFEKIKRYLFKLSVKKKPL